MKFKELFEKYLNSEASPAEKEIVENEIEKNEIINEYLADKIDEGLSEERNLLDSANPESVTSVDKQILRSIQKSINKKLKRVVISSVLIVLMIFIAVQFIVSPSIDAANYNPSMPMGKNTIKLRADMAAFTELHFPGTIIYHASSEHLGFGNYNINITQKDLLNGSKFVYQGKIEKGKMKNLEQDFYRYPNENAFLSVKYPFQDFGDRGDKLQIDELNMMPKSSIAKVYVYFKNDITIEEVLSLIKEYNSLSLAWVAVRSSPRDMQMLPLVGFEPSGAGMFFVQKSVDDNKYPCFMHANAKQPNTSEVLETHFKSLLKYMIDNKDFIKLVDGHYGTYRDTLSYVESNGVKSYGILVQGNTSEILKLRKNPIVDSIVIDDIRLSEYSR